MKIDRVKQLVALIGEKDTLQKKYSERFNELSDEELASFDALISYYIDQGETIDSLAVWYTEFINDLREERYYFVQNDRYRYSSAQEVDEKFYKNSDYMKMYMIGLALSTYLLTSHKAYMRWYKVKVQNLPKGQIWLEIGPGHGVYFTHAVNHTNFDCYYGIDISQSAVEMSRKIIDNQVSKEKRVILERKDFFELSEENCYDAIVVGEVLEHVEDPNRF